MIFWYFNTEEFQLALSTNNGSMAHWKQKSVSPMDTVLGLVWYNIGANLDHCLLKANLLVVSVDRNSMFCW